MWTLCLTCSGFCLNLLNVFLYDNDRTFPPITPHPPHPWTATFQLISSFLFKATWSLSQKLTVQVANPCLNFLILSHYFYLIRSYICLYCSSGFHGARHTTFLQPCLLSFPSLLDFVLLLFLRLLEYGGLCSTVKPLWVSLWLWDL